LALTLFLFDTYTRPDRHFIGSAQQQSSSSGAIMRGVWLTVLAATLAVEFSSSSTGAASAQSQESQTVTLVGQAVDAAWYMIHPPAASIPSHKDCAPVCLARGVPLAIANDKDNSLYVPAGGRQPLSALLDRRVRVTGTVAQKSEPIELKMDVGAGNQMVVRVDGGDNVVAIQTVEMLSAKSRK
jgi:hypothetical protein